jgi:xylulokinase
MLFGIDLGTTAVRAVIIGEDRAVLADTASRLVASNPAALWTEQTADDWVRAAKENRCKRTVKLDL